MLEDNSFSNISSLNICFFNFVFLTFELENNFTNSKFNFYRSPKHKQLHHHKQQRQLRRAKSQRCHYESSCRRPESLLSK